MNFHFIIVVFILFIEGSSGKVTRSEFYPVFEGKSKISMENMVAKLEKKPEQKAYLGAIKMKLSGLNKNASSKLKMFKEGRYLLETEIETLPNNIEWRFLRLIIQENAPKIVKYNGQLKSDAEFIESNFGSAEKDLQNIMKNYASQSETLSISKQ